MRKVLGVIFWIMAIAGVAGMTILDASLNNYKVFGVSLCLLVIGIIGVICTCKKSRERYGYQNEKKRQRNYRLQENARDSFSV